MSDTLTETPNPKTLRRQRAKLLLVLFIFAFPVIASWLLFKVFEWRPGTMNYGELIIPAKVLEIPELNNKQGKPLAADFWRKWTLTVVDNRECAEKCRDSLYKIRQLRIALGKDMDRMQTVLLLPNSAVSADFDEFLKDYPDMTVITAGAGATGKLAAQFNSAGKPAPGENAAIYLIDPLGNLMMYYAEDSNPSKMLRDFRRIMKVSQVG